MAGVTVDLTAEMAQAAQLAGEVIDQQVGPWVEGELREKWPRRTGRSADAWTYSGGYLSNNVEYTEAVATRDGPAVQTVLQPISNEARDRAWTE